MVGTSNQSVPESWPLSQPLSSMISQPQSSIFPRDFSWSATFDYTETWLVVWNHGILWLSTIYGIILPIDEFIFFKMVRSTTNQYRLVIHEWLSFIQIYPDQSTIFSWFNLQLRTTPSREITGIPAPAAWCAFLSEVKAGITKWTSVCHGVWFQKLGHPKTHSHRFPPGDRVM